MASPQVFDAEPVEPLGDAVTIIRPEASALEAIARNEVQVQLDAAHRWPRSPTRFLRDATSLATLTRPVAESCMYSLPRAGKMITGPSVRLAEICASTWGNLHVGARVIDETESIVIAQCISWDIERNVRITIEASRSIRGKTGKRFDADMIRVTGMAAISIALRNAVFRTIPRAYIDSVYEQARGAAVGDVKTLVERREERMGALARMGVTPERVFARLGVAGLSDIGLEHLSTLIGCSQSIKSGELDVDEAFPPVATPSAGAPAASASSGSAASAAASAASAAPEGRRVNVGTGARRGRPPNAARAENRPPDNASAAATPPSNTPPAAAPEPEPEPTPPAAVPVMGPRELRAMLAVCDDAWSDPALEATIAKWTDFEQWAAETWVRSVISDRSLAEQLQRPPHTRIGREPGED
jgi:hypothetical protein